MKMTIGMAFLCAGMLLAQDVPEKTTVPLRDPSRPATINAHLMAGGITVRGADVKDVSVEAHTRMHESHESREARAEGRKPGERKRRRRATFRNAFGAELLPFFVHHRTIRSLLSLAAITLVLLFLLRVAILTVPAAG